MIRTLLLLALLTCAFETVVAQEQSPGSGERLSPVFTAPDGTVLSLDSAFTDVSGRSTYFARVVYLFPPEVAQRLGADRRVETQQVDCAGMRRRFRSVTELSAARVVRGPVVPGPGQSWSSVDPDELAGYRAMCEQLRQLISHAEAEGQPITSSDVLRGPDLLNMPEVARKLSANYPPALRDAGASGRVEVRMSVTEEGSVDPASIAFLWADHPDVVAAAERVLLVMRFRPATLNGSPVRAWVQLPVTFAPY